MATTIALAYIWGFSLFTLVCIEISRRRGKHIIPPVLASLIVLLIILEMGASWLLGLFADNPAAGAVVVIMIILGILSLLETFEMASGSLAIYPRKQANRAASITVGMIILGTILYCI